MPKWINKVIEYIDQYGSAVLISQVSVYGSAPREPGAKMLVTRACLYGTIGGGNLEFQAIKQSHRLLENGCPSLVIQDYPLGPMLKQCCGGYVRLVLELLTSRDIKWLNNVQMCLLDKQNVCIRTYIREDNVKKHVRTISTSEKSSQISARQPVELLSAEGKAFEGQRPDINEIAEIKEIVSGYMPSLVVFGAGHIGQATVKILEDISIDISWFDSRPDIKVYTELKPVLWDNADAVVNQAPSQAYYLIFTHCHEQDFRLTRAVLNRGDAAFCGLIGSKTKRARFLRRLVESGIDKNKQNSLICPVGLTAIESKEPGVIAVGISAQILEHIQAQKVNRRSAGYGN